MTGGLGEALVVGGLFAQGELVLGLLVSRRALVAGSGFPRLVGSATSFFHVLGATRLASLARGPAEGVSRLVLCCGADDGVPLEVRVLLGLGRGVVRAEGELVGLALLGLVLGLGERLR